MATRSYNPTAANILSSIGIKGASTVGGTGKGGLVPVLDASGLLDISMLPAEEFSAHLSFAGLKNTAYVDHSVADMVDYTATGSISAPFPTLTAAAASNKNFSNFIIVSGDGYGDEEQVSFSTTDNVIRIFSTGTAEFDKLKFTWKTAGTTFVINNISVNTQLTLASQLNDTRLYLTGIGKVQKLTGSGSSALSEIYLNEVYLDTGYPVGSYENVGTVYCLASGGRIANDSTQVSGATVTAAIDNLGLRRIRIPSFTVDASGVHALTSTDDTAKTSASLGYGYYDLSSMGTALAAAVNSVFYKKDDSPTFSSVTATNITCTNLTSTDGVMTPVIDFGNKKLYIDEEYFLTIGEGSVSYPYQRLGDDLYFKSYIDAIGVQHYVKQGMQYDADIGWGAVWIGDYILVDGRFISVEDSSDSSSESFSD